MQKVKVRWRDLFFLSIGCIIATIANNWTFFTFSKEISLSDIFTAILGGFLGLYIASKLTSEVSSERIEKDLLINEISPIKVHLVKLYEALDTNSLELSEGVQIFKNTSKILINLKTTLKLCRSNDNLDYLVELYLGRIRKLNSDVTRLPTNSIGLILLPQAQLIDFLKETKEINDGITMMIFNINRL